MIVLLLFSNGNLLKIIIQKKKKMTILIVGLMKGHGGMKLDGLMSIFEVLINFQMIKFISKFHS